MTNTRVCQTMEELPPRNQCRVVLSQIGAEPRHAHNRPAAREGLKNRSERSQGKAHGAQRPRHITEIGEGASTAQRRHAAAQ